MLLRPFPRVPHLSGSGVGPGDLLLSPDFEARLFGRRLVVSEKLDGINVAVGVRADGRPLFEVRERWRDALGGGVVRALDLYLRQRERDLAAVLRPGWTLYGEWLWHRLTVTYDRLPDLFVVLAVVDRRGRCLPFAPARRTLERAGFATPPVVWRGRLAHRRALTAQVGRSRYGRGRMEGVVVELPGEPDPRRRFAKWVRPSYVAPTVGVLDGRRNRLAR